MNRDLKYRQQDFKAIAFLCSVMIAMAIAGCAESDIKPAPGGSEPAETVIDPGPAPPGQTEPVADPDPGIELPAPAPAESSRVPMQERMLESNTVFYLVGPQQASPPDGELPAGTIVAVIRDAGSYQLVRSPDGRQMYIPSSAFN